MFRTCDRCENPATVHLTEIKGGKKTERHLCENCARALHVPQASKAFALLAAYGTATVDAAVPSSALKTHHHGILRTTAAAAWALLEYHDRGVVTTAMLERLAQSVSLGGVAGQEAVRRHMRGVLEQMKLNCQ